MAPLKREAVVEWVTVALSLVWVRNDSELKPNWEEMDNIRDLDYSYSGERWHWRHKWWHSQEQQWRQEIRLE